MRRARHGRLALVSSSLADPPLRDDPTYRVARRVLQKGTGWVLLNHGRESLVTALCQEFPRLPIALVAIDNVEFGRIQARQLRGLLRPGARALCVRGNPFDSGCQERSAGLAEGLQGAHFSVEDVDGRWDPVLSETAVQRWITSPLRVQAPLHAVVAQNDLMAMAAKRVLTRMSRELGRPELQEVPVLGGDGLPGVGQAGWTRALWPPPCP